MIPKVRATDKKYVPDFGPRLPLFEITGYPSEGDGRVELPDGSLAYAIDDVDGIPGLYTEAVAMDAGDNVHRKFRASDQDLGGITAPTGPMGVGLSGQRGQLTCVGVGSTQVGWLKSR
jgi:hypothetical protein